MFALRKTCAVGFVLSLLSVAALAGAQNDRFIEFSGPRETTTFDLSTVQMIVPGRFTVSHTDIANPDYMQLQLATIDLLRGYCSSAEGTYRVEENAFAAGTPDLPVKPIEVKAAAWGTKAVSWEYPYSKFMMVGYVPQMHYSCKFVDKSEFETYHAQLAVVTGGTSSLMMFDCSHQLVDLTGDRGTMLYQTKPGSPVHDFYLKVCKAVTGEAPYLRSE